MDEQRRTLDAAHLREILIWVIGMHGDVSRSLAQGSAASAVLRTEDYSDVTVKLNFQSIAQLAENLRIITAVDVSNDLVALAQLMANIATIVNYFGPTVCDTPRDSEQIDPHAYNICTEFSIACVVSFAGSYGHDIPIDSIAHDNISLALRTKNFERLTQIFGESLRSRPDLQKRTEENAEALIRKLERQFAEASPIPEPAEVGAGRQLSAESYWNLCSAAEEEHWTATDVLILIEEHLSPVLHPHLVHHSSTVSGDDWRRLYYWIHRKD